MSNSEPPKTVRLNDKDVQRAIFLKDALDCQDNAEVVSESLNVAQHVVSVIRDGGKVILEKKNGECNRMVIKT